MNRMLLEGTPWKGILKFTWPVMAGLLLQQLYNTVDTIVVGNFVSQDALSAVGVTSVLTMIFLSLANGFSAGAGVIVAQSFGAGKKEGIRKNAAAALLLMLGMGVFATGLAFFISRPVLQYSVATPEDILDMALTYFHLYALGLIFQFGYNVVAAILRGVGDSRATMYFLLIAAVINIFLDIFLVVGCHMGVAGAAIATDLAQAGCCCCAFGYMIKKYPVFRWNLRKLEFNCKLAWNIIKAGFPMALQQFLVSIGFLFLQRAVNSYGKYMTASFTVAMRVEMYLNLPCSALQVTQANYTGQNLGAGKLDRVKKGAVQTVILSELFTLLIVALVQIFSVQIVELFSLNGMAAQLCTRHIRIASLALFLLAVYFPLLGLFQGAGDGLKSTMVATTSLFTRVLTTYTLGYIPLIGYRIIWLNPFFGFLAALLLTLFFLYNYNRKLHSSIPVV